MESTIMDSSIEGKIRSRIEAILVNDAKNYAAMRAMASDEEPLEVEPFAEERNLYQRIINSYRSGIGEVNSLLEENVAFISGLCQVVEAIREKEDFQEICSQTVESMLRDLGAEFCCLYFRPREEWAGKALIVEGVKEAQKLLFSHSSPTLLGSREFAQVVDALVEESGEFLNIADVYRDPRFHCVDFPSVVRSMVCLPIRSQTKPSGIMALSHSLPHYFTQNHGRILRILASMISHFLLLTDRRPSAGTGAQSAAEPAAEDSSLSVILLNLENREPESTPSQRERIRSFQRWLARHLEGSEFTLQSGSTGVLIFLPGASRDKLLERSARLRLAFREWNNSCGEKAGRLDLHVGCATCEDGEELTRALEMAGQIIQCSQEECASAEPPLVHCRLDS
jgi:hypothetical protein